MKKTFLLAILLLMSFSSLAQHLAIEALYYNPEEELVRIERKYIQDGMTIYVAHGRTMSFCIKQSTCYSGDTTIVEEEYYQVLEKPVKKEPEPYAYDMYTADYDTYEEPEEENRLPLIVNKTLVVSLDSLLFDDSRVGYYVDGFPVKAEIFESERQKWIVSLSTLSPGQVIYHNYFISDWPKPYEVDTISWNKDTSRIEDRSKRVKWEPSKMVYHIKGNDVVETYNDTVITHIKYLNTKNFLNKVLTNNILYFDLSYDHYLFFFEREQEVSIRSKNRDQISNYVLDEKGRVCEETVYRKGKYLGKTMYYYGQE